MSDGVKSEISSDIDQNYALNTADPKNVQELTIYVSKIFWERNKNNLKQKYIDRDNTQNIYSLIAHSSCLEYIFRT